MHFGTERSRRDWERLTPEQRDAVEAARARRQAPEARDAEERAHDLESRDAPSARPDPALLALLIELRAERERRGLTLTAAAERSGIERSMLNKLELGKIANPTYATLRAYAASLGLRLRLLAESDSVIQTDV